MKKIKAFFSNLFKKKDSVSVNYTEINDNTSVISESAISRYNLILLILAIILAVIFIIGIIPSSKNKPKIEEAQAVNVAPLENVSARIKFSKDEIKVVDHALNTFYSDKIVITAMQGKLKIDSIKLDSLSASVLLENNCENDLVPGLNSCTISLSWYPITDEDLSPKIVISWSDLSSLTPASNQSYVSLNFKTKETKANPTVAPISKPVEKIIAPTPPLIVVAPVKPVSPLKEIKRTAVDCKKYAISAYGVSGNIIGWIQPDKTVYSHRCTKILGKVNLNGEIIDENGNIIGYDPDGYEDSKLQRMLAISIPDNWFDYDSKKQRDAESWAKKNQLRNDARAKASGGKPKSHKIEDSGVFAKYVSSKVPYTITSNKQVSTVPKDETYVIRRYKPIPAVIAYPIFTSQGYGQMPAIGIIERNVYGENGRTVIIPAGSKVLGQATGTWPNTYVNYSKVQIEWLRIIRPDGAEFVFGAGEAISADAQGKLGVPGKGATDYLEQFVKPMITAAIPAAINLLNPVSSAYTSKFILDDDGKSSVTTSGNEQSSEKAKQELIKTWNTVANQFVSDSMKNNVPPFEVPAGTRITIYPTHDIMLRFNEEISFGESAAQGKGKGKEGLKDAGVGKIDAPTVKDDPEYDAYLKNLNASKEAIENVADTKLTNVTTSTPAPAPVKTVDPFYISASQPKSNKTPTVLPGETLLGQTQDGVYNIIQDSEGCFTADPATDEIVEEVYVEPAIGCN